MPPASPGPSRRRVLALALAAPAALLGGCGVDWGAIRRDDGASPPAAEPDADEVARRRAVRDATALLDAATAASAQVAEAGTGDAAGSLLAAVADVSREHLAALAPAGGRGATRATPSGTTPAAASAPAATTTAPAGGSLPVSPAEVVDLLAETTTTALADAMTTTPAMARLLVSVAAARAVLADRLAVALGVPPPAVPVPATADADPTAPDDPASTTPATTAAPSTTPPDGPGTLPAALAASIEAERAAAYAYGVLGTRLSEAARRSALVSLEEHRSRAGLLLAAAEEVGADLPAGAPAWELPAPVTTPEQAAALAVDVEQGVTAVHLDLVGASVPPLRATAAGLVVASALRAAGWGGEPVAFPGRA